MFGKTFAMLGSSWQVLKKDREMVLFFLLGAAARAALAYWAYLHFAELYPEGLGALWKDVTGWNKDFYVPAAWVVASYHFIGQFFSAAIVGSAARRFSDRNPTVLTGFWDAFKRLPSLLIWTLVYSALVTAAGLFKRKGRAEKAVGNMVQTAFRVATYLVLPLIMIENANPFAAIGRSAGLIGKTWGQQVVAGVSLHAARFVVSLPGLALAAGGAYWAEDVQMKWLCGAAGACLVIVGVGVVETLEEIFRTALYLYVRDEKAPAGFTASRLQSVFDSKS